MEKFSVLMSVYKNENPVYFRQALESVLNQTILPDEIILVRDGIVPTELQNIIDEYVANTQLFTYVPFDTNSGLGKSLNKGVSCSRNNLIARMDTDDICLKERFEKQLMQFARNKNLQVCGTQISEFYYDQNELKHSRIVPVENNQIHNFLKKRNPFNHMTVMFKKSAVENAGNYQDFHFLEDYYLWCRMSLKKSIFYNINEVLVHARTGPNMYIRRSGIDYFKSLKKLEKFKLKTELINAYRYIINLSGRYLVHVLFSKNLRILAFKYFARKRLRKSQ